MKWREKFVNKHGDRLFFMGLVFFLGCLFIALGHYIKGAVGNQLFGAGIAQLIAVAALANNKARSPDEIDKPKDEGKK